MSFEVVCQTCSKIARSLIPIVKADDSIYFECGACKNEVIRFFGMKSLMTEYISKTEDKKVI